MQSKIMENMFLWFCVRPRESCIIGTPDTRWYLVEDGISSDQRIKSPFQEFELQLNSINIIRLRVETYVPINTEALYNEKGTFNSTHKSALRKPSQP